MNNIFDFATSELSQDAFICYLINFAHKNYRGDDPLLTKCAEDFLREIIGPKYRKAHLLVTCLKRQYLNMDILVEVNNELQIIIEDKTYTHQSKNQIINYKAKLEKESDKKIITAYYKMIDQSHEEDVDKHIVRKDMLKLLEKYIVTENTIFQNYYQYIKQIDEEVSAFKLLPIEKWENFQYRGFFQHLTNPLNPILDVSKGYDWDYVPNQNGGLWAYGGIFWRMKNWLNPDFLTKVYLVCIFKSNIIELLLK
jgi:hypothetical protein